MILSMSHMFPNSVASNYGVFVKERIKNVAKIINCKVVAPVPYFPLMDRIPRYKYFNNIPSEELFDGIHVYHPRYFLIPKFFKWLDGFFYYQSLKGFMRDILSSAEIEILDFHWVYPDAYAGLKWARKFNKKIVVTIRGNESICYFENSLRKKMLIYTLKSVDHIIAVSNDMKEKVVNEYGVQKGKVTVIPNGIDTIKFQTIDKENAQRKCGLQPGKRYILSLCRLSEEKGLKYLLKSFSMLKEKGVDLVMVGDGPLRNDLTKLAFKLGIADRVHFIGEVNHDDTCYWYNAADFYCLPSLWEGCPNVVIESVACGTPVVSTCVGGIPDLIPTEDYGFIVSPANAEELSEALKKALEKSWEKEKILSYGASNTWSHVAQRVASVFERVIS